MASPYRDAPPHRNTGAFDMSDWHAPCPAVELLPGPGGQLIVWCPSCRCLSTVEGAGRRVVAADTVAVNVKEVPL